MTLSSEEKLQLLIDKAEDFKAQDVSALHVSKHCSFADYFLFMTGTSNTHIQSIAEAMLLDMKHRDLAAASVEGLSQAEWCLLDFGDVIVHIFNREKRAFFALEELWESAEIVFPPAN